jgi:hypothetical protein
MNQNHLDNYLVPRSHVSAWAWALPLLLAGVAVSVAVLLSQESARLERVSEKNVMLERIRLENAAPVAKPTPADTERQRRWQELRADRDFPWNRVFQAVEGADRSTIELLEFRPDKRNRRVVLRGEARDRDALVAYIQGLSEQPKLVKVHLLHMQAKRRERLETIEFEIKASIRND